MEAASIESCANTDDSFLASCKMSTPQKFCGCRDTAVLSGTVDLSEPWARHDLARFLSAGSNHRNGRPCPLCCCSGGVRAASGCLESLKIRNKNDIMQFATKIPTYFLSRTTEITQSFRAKIRAQFPADLWTTKAQVVRRKTTEQKFCLTRNWKLEGHTSHSPRKLSR